MKVTSAAVRAGVINDAVIVCTSVVPFVDLGTVNPVLSTLIVAGVAVHANAVNVVNTRNGYSLEAERKASALPVPKVAPAAFTSTLLVTITTFSGTAIVLTFSGLPISHAKVLSSWSRMMMSSSSESAMPPPVSCVNPLAPPTLAFARPSSLWSESHSLVMIVPPVPVKPP